jgi:hypothetical protein
MVMGGILRLVISPWAMETLPPASVDLLDHAVGLRQVAIMGLSVDGNGNEGEQAMPATARKRTSVFHG